MCILFLTITLLLGETHVDPTLWKWIPHRVVRPTWILFNKSVRECYKESVSSTSLTTNTLELQFLLSKAFYLALTCSNLQLCTCTAEIPYMCNVFSCRFKHRNNIAFYIKN